mmetsp:Transcript_14647/g.14273  ORF Transcript_14647/g.14273 Transcript_14647/m.14273 type:complete len:151 (+) Transcript_14647:1-453(+)
MPLDPMVLALFSSQLQQLYVVLFLHLLLLLPLYYLLLSFFDVYLLLLLLLFLIWNRLLHLLDTLPLKKLIKVHKLLISFRTQFIFLLYFLDSNLFFKVLFSFFLHFVQFDLFLFIVGEWGPFFPDGVFLLWLHQLLVLPLLFFIGVLFEL